MTLKEKRKHDEIPRYQAWAKRLKFILGVIFLGVFIHVLWTQTYNLWAIQDYPNNETQEKINALLAQTKGIYYEVPEFVSVYFAGLPETPICVYVDMAVLEDYNPDDLIAWSEMSFNDRRLPSHEVSIIIREVERHFGTYNKAQALFPRSALEICFKRGLKAPFSNGIHLLHISARDTSTHEILSYEWTFRGCLCR